MHDLGPLVAMLNRIKLTALRDQLDNLIDEASRRELDLGFRLSLRHRMSD